MTLVRWDPFGESLSLRQAMDRLLEDSFVRPRWGWSGESGGFDMDVIEHDDNIQVKASLPGVKPEHVNISVEDNVLTISGELRDEQELGGGQQQTQGQQGGQMQGKGGQGRYHRRERRYGRFTRAIALPFEVNADQADATFEHGVLTVTLPKSEQARKKQIPIKGQRQDQQMIEGEKAHNGNETRQRQATGRPA